MRHRNRHRITLAGSGLVLTAVALLTGCSGGTGGSAASGAPAGTAHGGMHAAPTGATGGQGRVAPSARRLVYTAQLSVRTANVAAAVAKATSIVTGAGGYVGSENLASGTGTPAGDAARRALPSTVQFKIPVAVYPATLAKLDGGAIGTRVSLQQHAQDMTEQVADVGSQVASDRAAIAQLRSLLSRAGSVSDLLTVQDRIDSEESSLESMEARQNSLNHETAYATVNLTVSAPAVTTTIHHASSRPPGPLRGLADGWHAFMLVLEWLLTGAGAAAPFAVVVAAAGYAVYRVRRRARAKPAP
ncbi:MAG: DUF4349 domain-containing protein [Nocardiopsaceae bacterium]|nr:DUF4349 domain-containing protein [Nocardiopsaceae bacterium]